MKWKSIGSKRERDENEERKKEEEKTCRKISVWMAKCGNTECGCRTRSLFQMFRSSASRPHFGKCTGEEINTRAEKRKTTEPKRRKNVYFGHTQCINESDKDDNVEASRGFTLTRAFFWCSFSVAFVFPNGIFIHLTHSFAFQFVVFFPYVLRFIVTVTDADATFVAG